MNLTIRFVSRRMALTLCLVLAVILSMTVLPARTQAQAAQSGRIRFIHAVPGAPAVDILVDKVVAARGLAYATATRYLIVDKGDHTITITASGTTTPLYQGKVTIAAGLAKTVVAQGTAASVELGLFDDELGPIGAGKTRVTAINAVKGGPSIDVLDVPGGNAPVLPLIQGLAYGQPYGTIDIPAFSAPIVVVSAGDDPNKAIAKLDKASLLAGTMNTFVFLGSLTGDGKAAVMVVTAATDPDDPTTNGLVRLVHAIPDAPAFDVYIGDVLYAPGLNFGDATPHIALTAGSLAIAVRVAGDPPTKDPLVAAKLDLAAGKATTLVISGTADKPILASSDDNIGQLDPKTARIHVINAASDGTATLALANGPAAVAQNPTSAQPAEVGAGVYDATLSIDKPALQIASNLQLSGGVLYDVIAAATDKTSKLIVASTSLSEQPGSAPAGASQAIAQNSTTAAPTAVAPAATGAATSKPAGTTPSDTPAGPAATEAVSGATTAATIAAPAATTAVPAATKGAPGPVDVAGTAASINATKAASGALATATPTLAAPASNPTATGPASDTQQTQAPAPVGTAGPTILGVVSTNPGVNLKIREYPSITARTLALVPSQTTLTINGVGGPAAPKAGVTPTATLPPTATTTPQEIDLGNVWLFVTWNQADGGTVSGWVSAQYLAITKDGKTVFQPTTILAFKPIPEDTFGVIGSSAVTPVSSDANSIIGTIMVNEGIRVQLRRTPTVSGESMTLLDNGAQVTVQSQTQTKLTGAVGEPSSPTWFFVRYETTTGAVTGWINAQYIKLSRKGRPADVTDVLVAPLGNLPRGAVEGSGVSAPVQPQGAAGPGISALVNKLNDGVNLQLRNNPDPNAQAVDRIALNTQLSVLGRNADGTWLQVNYNGEQGWVSAAYVTVTKNGKPMNIADLPNLTSAPSTAGSATPTLTPTSAG